MKDGDVLEQQDVRVEPCLSTASDYSFSQIRSPDFPAYQVAFIRASVTQLQF